MKALVRIWNFLICLFFGHDGIWYVPDYPVISKGGGVTIWSGGAWALTLTSTDEPDVARKVNFCNRCGSSFWHVE